MTTGLSPLGVQGKGLPSTERPPSPTQQMATLTHSNGTAEPSPLPSHTLEKIQRNTKIIEQQHATILEQQRQIEQLQRTLKDSQSREVPPDLMQRALEEVAAARQMIASLFHRKAQPQQPTSASKSVTRRVPSKKMPQTASDLDEAFRVMDEGMRAWDEMFARHGIHRQKRNPVPSCTSKMETSRPTNIEKAIIQELEDALKAQHAFIQTCCPRRETANG